VAAARLDEFRPAAALLRDLDDEDEWTALSAARSLAEIGNPAGFPVFIHGLRSADERVRAFAATCLALYSGARIDVWTDGPESERKKMVRAWRRWWLRNRSTFEVRRVERVGEGRPR
jgi:non-ribosomal peptide synthetase component F